MSFETPQVYPWRDPAAPPNSPALCIFFVQEPQVNAKITAETGVQTYDNVLVAYVAAKPQDKSNVAHEVRRTFPDGTTKQTNAAFRFAEPLKHYDAGTAAEALGTPLKDLLGMTPATIMNLKSRGISTIEVLADLPDSAGQEFMGFWGYRDQARKHIAHRKEEAPMVKLDALEAKHQREVEALKRQIADLASRVPEQAQEEVPVARRGRPPRQEAA